MRGKNEMRARVLSAIMTGTMVVSLCPSAAFAVSGDAVAKDGTYQKTVTVVNDSEDEDDWGNYDLNISLTVTEGKISAITAEPGDNYDSSNQGYVDKAVSKTKGIATLLNGADATENSVIDWDVVSGATCTSNAVKSAVLAMIQEAEEAGLEENTGSGEEPGVGEAPEAGEEPGAREEQQETSGYVTIAGVNYNWVSEEKEGYTQIADSGIYYAVAEENTALTGTLYGTASLSFTDFYAGDTSRESYDTISSATTSKYTLFANEDISEVTEEGYKIYGVKNVNVAVDAETYVEAQILSAANKLPSAGVYTKAASITLNEEAKEETSQYKTLQADGTYSATKVNIAATVTDATASLNTSSNWGDYEIDLQETSTNYIRNSRDDAAFAVNSQIQGLILETTDGTKVGMRYLDEIWVQPYEVAFSKDSELVGKTVNRITFVMPNATYVYELADGVYVKEQLKENMKVTATFEDENTVKVTGLKDFTNPKVAVYYVEGSGRNKVTTYYAQDVEAKDGVVSLEQAATAGFTYTVKVTSDDYVDTTVSVEFSAAEAGDNSGSDNGNEESSDSNSDTTSEDKSSSENNTDSNAGENSGTSDTSSGTTDAEPTATTETTSTTEPAATTATTSTASTTAVTTQENTYQSAEGYAMRSLEQNTVKIDGLASLLPEGTQISVSQLTSETDLARAKTAMNGVLQENCDYVVYEIDLSNLSGTEIHELAGYVSVTMAIPSGLVVGNGNTIVVYRLNDDGTLTKCTTTVKDGKVTFLTNHFSTFIFSEEPLEETTVKTGDETEKQIYMICLLLLLGMGILYLGNKRKSLKL